MPQENNQSFWRGLQEEVLNQHFAKSFFVSLSIVFALYVTTNSFLVWIIKELIGVEDSYLLPPESAFIIHIMLVGFFVILLRVLMINSKVNVFGRKLENITEIEKNIQLVKESILFQKEEEINVVLFDKLLSYAPIYAAKVGNYFKDEKLKVNFVVIGDDFKVAEKVRNGEAHFGIADPITVLEPSTDKKIKILLPLLKKLDVKAFARNDIFEETGSISNKLETIKIATYPRPSTSYSAALYLKEHLSKKNSSIKITLKSYPSIENSGKKNFGSHEGIKAIMKECDIILLWNPSSSAILNSSDFNELNYGLLKTDNDGLFTVENKTCETQKDDFELWRPLAQDVKNEDYKILATAVLVSQDTLSYRPELSMRFFRAICRALVRLEGIDWSIEANSKLANEIMKCAVTNRKVSAEESLKAMLQTSDANAGRSIFPFVDCIQNYEAENYTKHFDHLKLLWNKDEEISNQLSLEIQGGTLDEHLEYFYQRVQF